MPFLPKPTSVYQPQPFCKQYHCDHPDCTCDYAGATRPIMLDLFEAIFVLVGWGAAFFIVGLAYGITHP